MIDLLRAGLHRMRKEKLLKISLIFSFVYGIVVAIICRIENVIEGGEFLSVLFVVMASYISLTVGAENKTGVIRNKVISGHTKGTIFISELIFSTAVCTAMTVLFSVPVFVANSDLVGNVPTGGLCMALLSLIVASMFYAVIYTVITSLTGSPAVSLIICLALTAAVFLVSYECEISLGSVQYIEIERSGGLELIPNPRYVGGTLRNIVKCIDGLMPQGQVDGSMNYISVLSKSPSLTDAFFDFSDVANVFFYPIYGSILFALVSLTGWSAFRRKELR